MSIMEGKAVCIPNNYTVAKKLAILVGFFLSNHLLCSLKCLFAACKVMHCNGFSIQNKAAFECMGLTMQGSLCSVSVSIVVGLFTLREDSSNFSCHRRNNVLCHDYAFGGSLPNLKGLFALRLF